MIASNSSRSSFPHASISTQPPASIVDPGATSVPEPSVALATQPTAQAPRHATAPPLGNFGGALAWPVPLSKSDEDAIITLLQDPDATLPGLPLVDARKGALGYLLSGSSVANADLNTPDITLQKLLGSSKAQALGQALQTRVNGIATATSCNDYLLAAIHLGLDPELRVARPNSVAGFDLAARQYWGKPASEVIDGLSRHLIEQGRATVQTANLAACLLLARTAPELLVKDVPASVTYGSLLWTQLVIATAKVEADSPGRAHTMSYAEVVAHADTLTGRGVGVQAAEQLALVNWGAANALLNVASAMPSETEMERVRTRYNRQLSTLTDACAAVQTPIPSRRAMALAKLKEHFPTLDPQVFELPALQKAWLNPGRPGAFPGLYSMLDIVMEGGKLNAQEHWLARDKRVPGEVFCQLYETGRLDVNDAFGAQYDKAIASHEQGHGGLVQYLISTLPVEDRNNFEYGALEFFRTDQYKIAGDFFSPQALHTRGHTLQVKTTLDGAVNIYELDTRNGSIKKQNYLIARYTPPYTAKNLESRDANIVSKTSLFDLPPGQYTEKPLPSVHLQSYGSGRSKAIGKVFVKALGLGNDDLLQQARGVTSFDQGRATDQAIGEFFLNLIPLRSAIVNFMNGRVADGLLDLSLDVMGLVTLGAGKAAQAGKALSKGVSTLGGLSKVARFVGATAIEMFNPFNGLGDLAMAGGYALGTVTRLAFAKGRESVNMLRGATGSYDVLKAASQQHGVAATGTFKAAGQSIEGGAVLKDGKWYGLDARTLQADGSPLEGFSPATRAVDGVIDVAPGNELSNALFANYGVVESKIAGVSRNAQGVYVGADGHLSHIRHTDDSGRTEVYEVREVTRTDDGAVQARIYHSNRQTPLVVQHVQGDQWQRLTARGGNGPSVKADLGPVIGGGGESTLYASLDGKSVYKDLHTKAATKIPDYATSEAHCLNTYYGAGFAEAMVEDGRSYIKMKRLDGIALDDVPKRSLPPVVRIWLDDALKGMEDKGIYHNDLHLNNFLYSLKDKKVYPVDIQSLSPEVLASDKFLHDMTLSDYARKKAQLQSDFNELVRAGDR